MTTALRSELLKIRHTRSQLAVLLGGVAYAAVSLIPPFLASEDEKASWTADIVVAAVRGPMWLLAVVALLFGVMVGAGELRHRTLSTTALLTPRRSSVFAAKAAAISITTGAAAALAALISGTGAMVLARTADVSASPWSADVWATVGASGLVVVLYALTGLGVGLLARNDSLAITASLVWVTVIEGVLPIVLQRPWLGEWLPGGLVYRLMSVAAEGPFTVSVPAAAGLLAATVATLVAAGLASFRLRDIP